MAFFNMLTTSGEKNPHPAHKNTPLQKDAAMALLTPDPDVSPDPDHLPLVAATGMLLLQPNNITNLNLHGVPSDNG